MIFIEKLPSTRKENLKCFSDLRRKLLMLPNPVLRSEALFRLQHIAASSAVFDNEPTRYPSVLREAIASLSVFLNNH